MLYKRGLCRRAVFICPPVRLSVTFVYSVEMSKHVFNFFSQSGSHIILVFPYQTLLQYSDADSPTGASNARGVGTNRDCRPISGNRSMTARASAINN